jgi:hypothetical protein
LAAEHALQIIHLSTSDYETFGTTMVAKRRLGKQKRMNGNTERHYSVTVCYKMPYAIQDYSVG